MPVVARALYLACGLAHVLGSHVRYCSSGQHALDIVFLEVTLQHLGAQVLGLQLAQRLQEIPRTAVPSPLILPQGPWIGLPLEDLGLNVWPARDPRDGGHLTLRLATAMLL